MKSASTSAWRSAPRRVRPRRSLDALFLLQVYTWLLFVIPAGLRFGPLGAVGNPATVVGALLFVWWLVSMLTPSIGVVRTCVPVRVILALFWSAALVSYGLENKSLLPHDQAANSDRYLIILASFTGVVLVAAEGLRNRDEINRLIRTMVAGVAFMSTVAILQSRAHFDLTVYIAKIPLLQTYRLTGILDRDGLSRPAGTASHPIEFGVVVGLGLAFAIHVALYDRTWSWRTRKIALVLVGAGIPLAVSRSALLMAIVVLAVFFFSTTPALRAKTGAVVGGFAVVFFLIQPGLLGTLQRLVFAGQSDSSVSTRTEDYAAVAHLLRAQPWLGRGPGTFLPTLRILDNQYLLTLIEMGIIGFVLLLTMFSMPSFLGRGARLRVSSAEDRSLANVFLACGIGVALSAATYDALTYLLWFGFFGLIFGLSGCYWYLCRYPVAVPATEEERVDDLAAAVEAPVPVEPRPAPADMPPLTGTGGRGWFQTGELDQVIAAVQATPTYVAPAGEPETEPARQPLVPAAATGTDGFAPRPRSPHAARSPHGPRPARPPRPPRQVGPLLALSTLAVLAIGIPGVFVLPGAGETGRPAVIFGFVLFLWWFASRFLLPGTGIDLRFQPVRTAALALSAVMVLSYVAINLHPLSALEGAASDRAMVYALSLVGCLLIAADGLRSAAQIRVLAGRLVNIGTGLALLGIGQFLLSANLVASVFDSLPFLRRVGPVSMTEVTNGWGTSLRPVGTTTHAAELAVVLGLVLPFAVAAAVRDGDGGGAARWWKPLVIATGLMLTQSVAGIVLVVVAAVVFLPALPRPTRLRGLRRGLVLLVAVRTVLFVFFGMAADPFLDLQRDPGANRAGWGAIGPMVGDHPWFGRGFGTYLPELYRAAGDQYLVTAVALGVVGVVALGALLVTGLLTAWFAGRWAMERDDWVLCRCTAAAIAGAMAAMAFCDLLTLPAAAVTLFLLLGTAGAQWRILRSDAKAAGWAEAPKVPWTWDVAPIDDLPEAVLTGSRSRN